MESVAEEITLGTQAETIMTSPSSATDASCFYAANVEESSFLTDEVAREETETASADGASTTGRSEYYSARCEAMMQSRSKFSDQTELEIEFSKPHWSEVIRLAPLSEEEEEQNRENRKVFKELWNDFECGAFFERFDNCNPAFRLGSMIGKGGQAEIYASGVDRYVLKVFERGSLLQLRQLWPIQVLKREVRQCIRCGMMLEDGRFAFVMRRCSGDLRKVIDLAMQEKNIDGIQGPPFPYEWGQATMRAGTIMWDVAKEMEMLHKEGRFPQGLESFQYSFCVRSS